MKRPTINPVLGRELRQRMRGPRASIVLTLYLLVLSFIVWAMYEGVSRNQATLGGPDVEQIAGLGRSVFQTLLFSVLTLVCFIVPGLTAGGIAGERERQTLVPLQVTLLRSRSILFGKLLASLAFISLLIVATLPIAGVAFLLGGVELWEVLRATAMVLVVAFVLACLSLLASTVLRRTQGATVVAYGVVFILAIGTFVVFGAQAAFTGGGPATRNQMVLQVNPFMAVASVLESEGDIFSGGLSPFTPMQALIDERTNREMEVDEEVRIIDGRPVPMVPNRPERRPLGLNVVPFAIFSLAAYAGISAASLAIAAGRLRVPRPM